MTDTSQLPFLCGKRCSMCNAWFPGRLQNHNQDQGRPDINRQHRMSYFRGWRQTRRYQRPSRQKIDTIDNLVPFNYILFVFLFEIKCL